MQRYCVYCGEEMIADDIGKANHFFSRFIGLMFKKKIEVHQGLWIEPCSQVHTFNMRFDIDVVFIDCDKRILHIEHCMKPRRISKMISHSHSVLELCAGRAAECGIEMGDVLSFQIKHL